MAYIVGHSEPIAIVGSSCRFAGHATSPSKLWDLLCKPEDLSREVPPQRFSAKGFYHEDGEYHGTTNSVRGYWLEESPRRFDPSFFNITPKEAEAMDPQQRLLLEAVFEAMESAGFPLSRYGGKAVGVFSGCMTQDYEMLSSRDELATLQYFPTGNSRAIMANRISYFFDFRGPSMTIDTACSSSLVALHQAVLNLQAGYCSMACVTGANLMLTPEQFIVESALHMLSPTGKCHMWDTRRDGYARGEGVAALLIKPLSRAIADGDNIEAVIRAIGTNSDGRTGGLTIPNPEAQATLIRDTYRRAGLDPTNPSDRCQYFEAHGTGTAAGDPREAAAIHAAFFGDPNSGRESRDDTQSPPGSGEKMLVGSIKTVIGHTEAAAGLAGVLKAVCSMKHGLVPPNLHFENLNPEVKPFYTHLQIPTAVMPWPDPPPGQPRRASVNSFGFGGANAHAIIESYVPEVHNAALATPFRPGCYPMMRRPEPATRVLATQPHPNVNANAHAKASAHPDPESQPSSIPFHLPIVISAASHKSLRDLVQSYRTYLDQTDVDIHELAWHQYSRRTGFPYQVAFSAASTSDALAALDSLLVPSELAIPVERTVRSKATNSPLRILGIFTGQGAQWPTMSKSFLQLNGVYRDTIRKLDGVLQRCPHPCSWTLEGQIMAGEGVSRLNEAAVSQPLCTALQIALVEFMRSIGVDFHTVIGHSSGEIAAAYAAGRLSAADAIVISYYRGMVAHLAGGSDGQKGGMLVTRMSESEALRFCDDPSFGGSICIAARNSPTSVTLSGDLDSIHLAHKQLKDEQKLARLLPVDTAYHSHHMTKPAVDYTKAIQEYGVLSIPEGNGVIWISSVKNRPRTGALDLNCQYWVDNMVEQVQFHEAVEHALSQSGDEFDCAIEIGPHSALQSPVSETAKALGRNILYSSPLNRTKDSGLSVSNFLEFLWSTFGSSKIDLRSYLEQSPKPGLLRSRLDDAPPYPFDHSVDYWRESRICRQYHFRTEAPHELLGVRAREDNMYEMKWRNILKLDKIPWLEHHGFQDQALLPASAYCVMALDAARYFLADRPASLVELRDIEISSGIVIDREPPGVETLFSLNISTSDKDSSSIDATFALYSCPEDGTTRMNRHATGSLHIILGEPPSMGILPRRQASLSETLAADPEAFYEMMNATGLMYTGPFKALTSIQRRYRHCCATLCRFHPVETTKLQVSPATLDACFQSAFLTFASPGDGSLWTSFLPTRIGRIQFNLAALKGNNVTNANDTLTVDTHMVSCTPPIEGSRASIAIDSTIFNEAGEAEIQFEELVVRALANTSPKDDLELYLHTVVDVDPTDEIVQADNAVSNGDAIVLAENCRRIASFVLDNHVIADVSVTKNSSSRETQESIDSMILNSNHADYLDSIKSAGKLDPTRLSKALPCIGEETRQVSIFRNHVGRIVKQIAHRYPWMNILYLPTAQLRLTRLILAAIGDSFQSFTVGRNEAPTSSGGQDTMTQSVEGVQELDIDLKAELSSQIGPDVSLDLVILPTTLLGTGDATGALKNISEAMKPGGFLVLVNPYTTKLGALSGTHSNHGPNYPPTPPRWPDALDACGFTRQARNCNHFHQSGYILVRQFGEHKPSGIVPEIKGRSTIANNLLFVRGVSGKGDNRLVASLQDQLSPYCGSTMSRSLDDATAEDLENCTAVIVLADLDEPVMSTMTQHRISQLHTLLRPTLTVLWVTCDSRGGNPEHAASFGFLRTIAAEVPTLKLQVLDLDPNDAERPAERISSAFHQLVRTEKDVNSKSMWTLEPEIHMDNGRRLIPRVMPWKHANDRVNALRRIVTKPVNTISQCVELVPEVLLNGFRRFVLREQSPRALAPGGVTIQVDYSSALPFKLKDDISGYVCVGRETTTGERMVALSGTNSSYLTCPSSQALALEGGERRSLIVLHGLIRCMAALRIVSMISPNIPIILIDPDVELARRLMDMVTPNHKVVILGTCCGEEDTARFAKIEATCEPGRYESRCLHPRALMRDLRQAFPQRGSVFNFLPETHELFPRIAALIPSGCTVYTGSAMFGSGWLMRKGDYPTIRGVLKRAMKSTGQPKPERSESIATASLSELQQVRSGWMEQPFQIINWNRESDALQVVGHTVDGPLVYSHKTYYLFGMTRDFGHSLCRFFLEHGARNIVLASRNPDASPNWVAELNRTYAATIRIERADVTSVESLLALKQKMSQTMPAVGGVVNGAMVLDDHVFAQMTIETWDRVLRPKTVGSANLDKVFSEDNLDFFIMTSSFAAVGGHPGQSNYAAANMYMNGLAAHRRRRGLVGTALNIGVIYGLGFLRREKSHLYAGLEREGYPPISEHNLHHMFLEAIVAGRPSSDSNSSDHEQRHPFDITTGLRRYLRGSAHPLHWHVDPRFGHFALRSATDNTAGSAASNTQERMSLREELAGLYGKEAVADTIGAALAQKLQTLLQFPDGVSIDQHKSLTDLGVDSLSAVEVRDWFYKSLGKDFAVMKIMNAPSIQRCHDDAHLSGNTDTVQEGGPGLNLFKQRTIFFGTPTRLDSRFVSQSVTRPTLYEWLPLSEAEQLLEHFNSTNHFQHPFFPPAEMAGLLHSVYNNEASDPASPQVKAVVFATLANGALNTSQTDLAETLFNQAKQEAAPYDDEVSLTMIHFSLLLATYQNNMGRPHSSYLHTGVASRKLFSMGLNSYRPEGNTHPDMIQKRRITLWSVYYHETMHALYLGRESTYKKASIRTPYPEGQPTLIGLCKLAQIAEDSTATIYGLTCESLWQLYQAAEKIHSRLQACAEELGIASAAATRSSLFTHTSILLLNNVYMNEAYHDFDLCRTIRFNAFFLESSSMVLFYDMLRNPSKLSYNKEYIKTALSCLDQMVNDEPIVHTRPSMRETCRIIEAYLSTNTIERQIPEQRENGVETSPTTEPSQQQNIPAIPAATHDFLVDESQHMIYLNGVSSGLNRDHIEATVGNNIPEPYLQYQNSNLLTTDLFNFFPLDTIPVDPNAWQI
ncbi:hypothetical protein E0Z10_g7931 [Xylaria hypoxylon]|uniref:Uncharacterized protein n=1 Tax=Xylaria hypoxylon TaxID=37992 RepID=A0A4Z0YPB8_9PEZI|nr:hypothetical protein E0Z10_g7931 [Xylaria hypoxylon]